MGSFASQDPAADGYARKYDADGNVLWMIQFGTPTFDNAQDVALRKNDVYVVGNTPGLVPRKHQPGLTDAYLMRIRGEDIEQDDDDDEKDDDDTDAD